MVTNAILAVVMLQIQPAITVMTPTAFPAMVRHAITALMAMCSATIILNVRQILAISQIAKPA
jgi:hypothetical protein